ncbi:LysM peptidoglycan-binding domain-containing protein [Massilia sp. H6]|uniref:LysM peptidoglycan-binding domain-containing protein n=1 Tax=Massilia sp. H6 TaxID=2970464 RepID=UPI0021672AA5|nr:LysM peptidoglycan-binding domain-containing protein [Massilia sp. H6]UVW28378.1 LysM peptidoglycan-binding domain-containing protein [Massilia sp. H6]
MKTLLAAVACITLLSACKKDEPVPATTAPVAVVPDQTTTTPTTPATSMPPATETTEVVPAAVPATATVPESGSSGSSGSSVAGMTEAGGDGMYEVEKGDTLWGIAEKNSISHGDLAKWNNIADPKELHVGRKLRLTAP